MDLTMESLMQAINLVKKIERETARPLTPFNGIRVIEDHNALADTTERTFPSSRHRSKRIRKKLVKRFGGEFKKTPTIFQIHGVLYAHPVRYAELKRQFTLTNC